jgi:hypothetical protein
MENPAYAAAPGNTPGDFEQIVAEAYVFGYPLVLMEITRKVQTNAPKPTGKDAAT